MVKKDRPLEQRVATGDFVLESEATKAAPPIGPAEAASRVAAAILLGDDPTRDNGNMEVANEVDRQVLAQGKNHCRLYKFSSLEDCSAYSEMLDKEQSGMIRRVAAKELISGTDYALFINWIAFDKPEPQLRETIQAIVMEKAKEAMAKVGKKPAPVASNGPPQAVDLSALPDDPYCRGFKPNGERCRRKHVADTLFCKHHDLSDKAPRMDAPPPTHTGLPS